MDDEIRDQGTPRALSSPSAILLGALIVLYCALVARTAWVSDDAYISLRMVDNLVEGRGWTWNPGERVLAGTNPLWMLLLAPALALSGEEYFSTLAVSALCCLAVIGLLVRQASGWMAAAAAVSVLAMSRAYVDYSTSGLENPLTFLLLAAFAVLFARPERGPRDLFGLTLIASLSVVNRMDVALLLAPAVAWRLWRHRSLGALGWLLAGALPFLAWEAFSLLYFGFPFPNTAYAKLNTDIPKATLAAQGLRYYAWTLAADPLTLVAMPAAGLLALLRARRSWPLLLGAALYLVYVVRIGGDFMGGRFFAAPLLLVLFAAVLAPLPRHGWLALVGALGLGAPYGLKSAFAAYGDASDYEEQGKVRSHELVKAGIADERLWHSDQHGLFSERRAEDRPRRKREDGRLRVEASGGVGLVGFRGGESLHLVDVCGLGDALVARLPAAGFRELRVGHYYRVLPRGYVETLETGEDRFEDRDLAEYYRRLERVMRGPLLDADRLREIWRFNTGENDALIQRERYRDPPVERITLRELRKRTRKAPLVLWPNGVDIGLGGKQSASSLDIELAASEDYIVHFMRGDKVLGRTKVKGDRKADRALVRVTVQATDRALRGYNTLHVEPARMDNDQRIPMGMIFLPASEGEGAVAEEGSADVEGADEGLAP